MLLFVRISSYYYFIEEKRTAIYLWALYEHVVGGVTVCAANFDQRLLKFYHEGPNSVVGKSIAGGREVEPHGVEQYPPVPESYMKRYGNVIPSYIAFEVAKAALGTESDKNLKEERFLFTCTLHEFVLVILSMAIVCQLS